MQEKHEHNNNINNTPPPLTGPGLGRRRARVPAAQHQEEADRLAQVQVAPAGQRAVARRVRQVGDGHRREVHEVLALRLHHLHHGDERARARTMKRTRFRFAFSK